MNRKVAIAVGLLVLLISGLLFLLLRGSETQQVAIDVDAPPGVDAGVVAASGKPGKPPPVQVPLAAADAGATGAAADNVFAKAGWGSGQGQLGRERRQEGNAEGPMSLAPGRNGELVVLDQANGRLSRYGADGKFKDTVPMTVQSAQDVVVGADGKTYVLDRLADGVVSILGPDGKPIGELPLIGPNVKEGGGITGMFIDGEDVYVEQDNGILNRIGDTKGKSDGTQPEIPGRPTRDGRSFISAGIVDGVAGRVFVSAIDRQAMAQRFTREFRLTPIVRAILLLDTDASGVIYFAVLIIPAEGKETVQLLCLDPLDGRPLGTTTLPPNTLPEETFRDFAVLDQGGVVYSYRTDEGVELRRYDCR